MGWVSVVFCVCVCVCVREREKERERERERERVWFFVSVAQMTAIWECKLTGGPNLK